MQVNLLSNMNRTSLSTALLSLATLLLVGCQGSRFVSADADLESIYMGKSYYDIVDEFGRPDVSTQDEEGGTRIVYNAVSLNGTSAARLYRQYNFRNRSTKEEGQPSGPIVFSFNIRNKCYAVQSDFLREKSKSSANKPKSDSKRPQWAKPRVPRSFDFPYVDRRSPYGELVTIEKIEIERDKTVVYFSFCDRTPNHRPLYDKGLAINPDVFIRDCATGKRVKFVKPDGIFLYPQYTDFAHNRGGYDVLVYSLTFEALPLETETIDIIEPGPEGFNFYGVDVRTPLSFGQSKQANPIPEN